MKKAYKKPDVKIVEHPELKWWFNAITVRAHNQNLKRRNK
jgi:hypothetical protein